MKSLLAGVLALFLTLAGAATALGQEQQPQNIAQQNSDAVARKLFSILVGRQLGAPVPPDRLWAYEVDLNLDGFPEIYGYVDQPGCDGMKCGLFLFVLEGSDYHEVLGDLLGARLTDPAKVFLGAFKRNGFLELQLGEVTAAWDGGRYVDASGLPRTTLDGTAYLEACTKYNPRDAVPGQGGVSACQCRLNRLQAIAFTQEQLDNYAKSLANVELDPDYANSQAWFDTQNAADDVVTGCGVVDGSNQWTSGFFAHGEKEQAERLDFESFIDTCKGEDWIMSERKVGSADRALGLCGCLARELPAYGVGQGQMDMLTRYYAGDISDAEVDQQDAALLESHDAVSEACLQQFPQK